MSDPEEILPDDLLAEMLSPLRETAVPPEVRLRNRAAVAQALARTTRTPWWRRTVAVPLPLAIAATLAMVAVPIALLVPVSIQRTIHSDVVRPMENRLVTTDVMSSSAAPDAERMSWSVTRSYIQSIESLASTRVPMDSNSAF